MSKPPLTVRLTSLGRWSLPVHEIEALAAEADTLGFRHAPGAAVVGATGRRTRKVREAARAAMPRRTLSGRSSSSAT